MPKYEDLMNKADKALLKAISEQDSNLRAFYLNAANGFKIKAMKLTVEEAQEEV